jgi:fatty-acyl-CoA synthase
MQGLMMETPLLISSLIEHAGQFHADTEIVTRTVEGPIHRYDYGQAHSRSRKLAKALAALGVGAGERIATVAWNTHRHLEIYYAVSGMGAVCHTINPRLFPPQIVYIINHAEDSYVFVDLTFVPLLEAVADKLESLKGIVVMTDEANMPETKLAGMICYESLIAEQDDDYAWPSFDESTASSLCYTSGTTGNAKGVLYSHRSTVLHSFAACLPDGMYLSARETLLPIVPMFHVNAWGLPYSAAMAGCKLVMPGAGMDGASLHEMIETEQVNMSAGVPTIWFGLLAYLRETGKRIDSVERIICGGSAVPRAMAEEFEDIYGTTVTHGWGMTEMSPLGSTSAPKHGMHDQSRDDRLARVAKQGRPIYGVQWEIRDDDGNVLPQDGEAFGELWVRGPWIARDYYKSEDAGESFDADGWFATGDVCTIDPDGYMQITDRSKDVIKSGGEWISSIDLENIAVGHPAVHEAAAIGVRHSRWDERPLLLVVTNEGAEVTRDEMIGFYDGKIAKWWTPDDVVFVDELPHTATGKLLKTQLREEFRDHKLPTDGG